MRTQPRHKKATEAAQRVLVMTTRYPLDHPGGVERVASALAQRLGARSQDWRVVHTAAYRGRARTAGVPLLGDLFAAVRLATRTRGSNAVMVHGAEYAWAPMAVAKLTGRPCVVVWHGVRGLEALPPARSRLGVLAQWAFVEASDLLSRIALYADATVVVSPSVAEEVRSRFGFRGELHVIPNGVEPVIDHLASSPFQEGTVRPPGNIMRRGGEEAVLRVIWIGTTPYKKGLDLALAACLQARLEGQELTLTVVGVTHEQAGLGAAPAAPWISWPGRLSPARVAASLSSHDVLLCPTRYEACCMVVLEALAAGIPVVGSMVVGWQIGDAGETIAGEEPASYSAALRRMADPARRHKLATAARFRAQEFTWEQATASYLEVLTDVTNSTKDGHLGEGITSRHMLE
ncbi:MAG: glycosyltransferase family 4 protein [Candidatus Dormiibacterota bacterium]